MALQFSEKQRLFDYAVQQLQQFLVECGRTTHVILQSDQEDYLIALTKAVANTMGNITTRTSPAYSSQSQGGVERAHRTLFGQIRTLRAQMLQSYNRTITMKHPITPWIVRHSAYIVNRYAIHANGFTSFHNRWHKEQHTPVCEFDTTAGESLIGIHNKILRARTIRRQIKPHKYNQQLFDVINMGPWSTPAYADNADNNHANDAAITTTTTADGKATQGRNNEHIIRW